MSNKNENIYIVYSSIIREKNKILSEYTECSGNFFQIIKHIMKEIILKFQDPPDIYRTYFFFGKYALFLIKYQKIYILIMFPKTKINNIEIIFALLYSLFDKLKSKKDIEFEKLPKMREYSLNFTDIFKDQIKKFNSDCTKFIPYVKNSNEFKLYEPFENRNFESDIQLPILSNIQVHNDKNNNINSEDLDKEENEQSSYRKSYNSIYTQDSFKDDILNKERRENLLEEDKNLNELINKNIDDEDNIILKVKNKNNDGNKCKIIKWIFIIIIIVLLLGGISFGLYIYLK